MGTWTMSFFDPLSTFNRTRHGRGGWQKRVLPPKADTRPGGLPPKHAVSKTQVERWVDRLDDQIREIDFHGGEPQVIRALEDLRDDMRRSARML